MGQPQKQITRHQLISTNPQISPNAAITTEASYRSRPDPSIFQTGSPPPRPALRKRRVPSGGAAPPSGAASSTRPQHHPRLRTGPDRTNAFASTLRGNGPGGIKKKKSGTTQKGKGSKGESDVVVGKWLECVPKEVVAVFVNMHEHYASSVNELRAEMSLLRARLERGGSSDEEKGGLERVRERLDEYEALLRSVVGRLWGGDGRGVDGEGEGDGEVVEEMDVEEMDIGCDGSDGMGGECEVEGEGEGIGGVGSEGDDDAVDERGGDEPVPATSPLNMDVPPTPIGERHPIRSTGLRVVRRRPGARTPLPLRQRADRPFRPSSSSSSREEQVHRAQRDSAPEREEGRVRGNDDDDGLKILDGAPRLCALLRRQHGIASPPKVKSFPRLAHVEPDSSGSDSDKDEDEVDEYRPGSPSVSSGSSSPSANDEEDSVFFITTFIIVSTIVSTEKDNEIKDTKSNSSSSSSIPANTKNTRDNSSNTITTTREPIPITIPIGITPSKPRYSTPRRTTLKRTNSGPQYAGEFTFRRRGRTVLSVWNEYKVDGHGDGIAGSGKPFRCIESLEKEYGTCWRTGSVGDIKYASNYVGVRKKIVDFVEGMCEGGKMTPEEACAMLDERVDGRLQELITVLRKGLDPFKAIPVRAGKSVST
ncbi:hypothetical protein TgHK011_008103 [Trichoderma gracile]|nr:hypothetical protein TgHK011_008103 [Trichoderma gracile]